MREREKIGDKIDFPFYPNTENFITLQPRLEWNIQAEVITGVDWPIRYKQARLFKSQILALLISINLVNTNLIRSLYNWRKCQQFVKCSLGVTNNSVPFALLQPHFQFVNAFLQIAMK
jgi:hypothetical protein